MNKYVFLFAISCIYAVTETNSLRLSSETRVSNTFHPEGEARYDILVGIMSAPENRQRREWIRKTWANKAFVKNEDAEAKIVFVIAESSRDQVENSSDIMFVQAQEHTSSFPREKTFLFMQNCANLVSKFCVKTDDDVYLHVPRLAFNLRNLYQENPNVYAGAIMWGSFVPESFQVCGITHMSRDKALSNFKANDCSARGAKGPFPFAIGALEILSVPVAKYLVQPGGEPEQFVQRGVSDTEQRWKHGEDMALGMWVDQAKFNATAIAFGWSHVHDLCGECRDKTQFWRPVTEDSVAVHVKGHQMSETNFYQVHEKMKECDSKCVRTPVSMMHVSVPHYRQLLEKRSIWEMDDEGNILL